MGSIGDGVLILAEVGEVLGVSEGGGGERKGGFVLMRVVCFNF